MSWLGYWISPPGRWTLLSTHRRPHITSWKCVLIPTGWSFPGPTFQLWMTWIWSWSVAKINLKPGRQTQQHWKHPWSVQGLSRNPKPCLFLSKDHSPIKFYSQFGLPFAQAVGAAPSFIAWQQTDSLSATHNCVRLCNCGSNSTILVLDRFNIYINMTLCPQHGKFPLEGKKANTTCDISWSVDLGAVLKWPRKVCDMGVRAESCRCQSLSVYL